MFKRGTRRYALTLGILPYRDIRAYNFPGAIYLFWALGKVAGWGRPWALYAVDAAALLLLGITLAALIVIPLAVLAGLFVWLKVTEEADEEILELDQETTA